MDKCLQLLLQEFKRNPTPENALVFAHAAARTEPLRALESFDLIDRVDSGYINNLKLIQHARKIEGVISDKLQFDGYFAFKYYSSMEENFYNAHPDDVTIEVEKIITTYQDYVVVRARGSVLRYDLSLEEMPSACPYCDSSNITLDKEAWRCRCSDCKESIEIN